MILSAAPPLIAILVFRSLRIYPSRKKFGKTIFAIFTALATGNNVNNFNKEASYLTIHNFAPILIKHCAIWQVVTQTRLAKLNGGGVSTKKLMMIYATEAIGHPPYSPVTNPLRDATLTQLTARITASALPETTLNSAKMIPLIHHPYYLSLSEERNS
jgi:hypothetical protein